MFRRRLRALALLALPAVACASGRRNVVLFIGDGMGFRAVELASLWATGRPDAAPFADWPLRMAMSTPPAGTPAYDPASSWQDFDAVRHKVTDSAAAASSALNHSGWVLEISLRYFALPERVWIIVGSRKLGISTNSSLPRSMLRAETCDSK